VVGIPGAVSPWAPDKNFDTQDFVDDLRDDPEAASGGAPRGGGGRQSATRRRAQEHQQAEMA
jgi:hypothetical protein